MKARIVFIVLAIALPLMIVVGSDGPEVIESFFLVEGGIVETASAILWFLAAVAALAVAGFDRRFRLDWLLAGYLLLLFGFRELDLHTRLFDWNINVGVNYWKRPNIPYHEKALVVMLLIIPLALAIVTLFRRWVMPLLRRGAVRAQGRGDVLFWGVALIVTAASDKLYLAFGSVVAAAYSQVFEESLELTFAFYTLLLVGGAAFSRIELLRHPQPAAASEEREAGIQTA